jgi:methionyl-tRNA formyltransferase
MMGTGTFAEPTFSKILQGPHEVVGLVTQPDRPVGEERGSTRLAGRNLKALALERGIPVLQPESVNTPEQCAALAALAPDLLVVAAYGQILSREVLGVAPHGGINVHGSLLPKYRGAAPVAWAIYHGEIETGVTVIQMSVHLDAGRMLAREATAIGTEEIAAELEVRLAEIGARLAAQVIDEIASGSPQGIPQDKSQATKAPKLKKEHGAIDWSRSGGAICNHVRAMQPWPTAFTFWHRSGSSPLRIIIHKAREIDSDAAASGSPGQVLVSPEAANRLLIAAGGGELVEIVELQPAGKRRMSAGEFARGHRPQAGDRLGPESA